MKTTLCRLRPLALLGLAVPGLAAAFTVGIRPDDRMLYLRVGDGEFGNHAYNRYSGNSSQPRSGGAINEVSGSVPTAALGNGRPQPLTGSGRLTSDWDGYAFCTAGEVYIGGFFRAPGNGGNASLTAVVTTPLSNGSDTIPFSQIGWTASGRGDDGEAQPIPSGTFGDSTRVLASFPVNVWQESCHRFHYRNERVVAAGTYTGRITYTLAAP